MSTKISLLSLVAIALSLTTLSTVAQPSVCPHDAGYWKNHPTAWPVTSLTLGSQTYTQTELLAILGTSPGTGGKADASLQLADLLISAKLNIANGVNGTPIAATITTADGLLAGFSGKLPYNVSTSSTVGRSMLLADDSLDKFNGGKLTPGCH